MSDTLYKVLGADGRPCHGGKGIWHLPHGDQPGAWMPPIHDIALCRRGYHACTLGQLISWLGPCLYELEYAGARLDGADKVVVAEARLLRRVTAWNERTARLFAADCAAHVLAPDADPRSWAAIDTARRFANDQAGRTELEAVSAAAQTAARAAARAATWAAARAAAETVVCTVASAAASAVASAAAETVACTVARIAARATEHRWQVERLALYLAGSEPPPVDPRTGVPAC